MGQHPVNKERTNHLVKRLKTTSEHTASHLPQRQIDKNTANLGWKADSWC